MDSRKIIDAPKKDVVTIVFEKIDTKEPNYAMYTKQ